MNTSQRASISSTYNDIRDVIESQRENGDIVKKGGDFESDEEFLVEKKKMASNIKKKVKVFKSKTSNDVSSTSPSPANDSALNTTGTNNLKSEGVLQSARDEDTGMIVPPAFAAPTVLQVANEHVMKIPNILSNVDNQVFQLLYTIAMAPTENALPSSTSQEVAKSIPCQTQKFIQDMVQGTSDLNIESLVGRGTKIMYTENTSAQPPPTTTPSSQQAAKTLPSQIKKLIPGQLGKNHGQPQAAKVPSRRGRGRNVRQAGPTACPRPTYLAPDAPRPARLLRMLRPSPPARFRQMRPRVPGNSDIMFQSRTPTVSPISRPRIIHGLSSTPPLRSAISTPGPQPVAPPLVVNLDKHTFPQHVNAVAPRIITTTTTPIPNLVLPPNVSITRTPRTYSTDTDNISTTNITSLARALVKVGDTEGNKCLVLYELTESQIQGLGDLGLKERRI